MLPLLLGLAHADDTTNTIDPWANQAVLDSYLTLHSTRSGYRVQSVSGKLMHTQTLSRMMGNDALSRRLILPNTVKLTGAGLSLAPALLFVSVIEEAADIPVVLTASAIFGAPGGVMYLTANHRLKNTARWIPESEMESWIDEHNRGLLASNGVDEAAIPQLLYQQKLMFVQVDDKGQITVQQGTGTITPWSFASQVGDSTSLSRSAGRSTLAMLGAGSLGVVAVGGAATAAVGAGVLLIYTGVALFYDPSVLTEDYVGLQLLGITVGGAAVAGAAGAGAVALGGLHIKRNRSFNRWYTEEEVQRMAEEFNASQSPEAMLLPPRERWVDGVSVSLVVGPTGAGLVGRF